MDGQLLQRSARAIYNSPLGRVYQASAAKIAEHSINETVACPKCYQLWIPGVTCKVRMLGHSGSKRSRAKQRRRIEKYLANVAMKNNEFVPKGAQRLTYTCLNCANTTKIAYLQVLKSKPQGTLAPKGRSKKKAGPDPAIPKAGLSLSDFLL